MSMPTKDNTANPQQGSSHYEAPMFSSSPQCPSLRTAPRIWPLREPSIADECGRHSDLLMDLDGATTGTRTRPKGWAPDPPVVPRAQKILIVAGSRGEHDPAGARPRCGAHGGAKPHVPGPSPVSPDTLPFEVHARQEPSHKRP